MESDPHAQDRAALMEQLWPIAQAVAELDPAGQDSPEAVASLEAAMEDLFPAQGEAITALGKAVAEGVAKGWLCDRGPADARFCRLAKPGEPSAGLSIDLVDMTGEAIEHTHPKGEVTICWAAPGSDAEVRFDGRAPGWVFLGPQTRHVPTVTGGRMHLLYFLPEGAVEWHGLP